MGAEETIDEMVQRFNTFLEEEKSSQRIVGRDDLAYYFSRLLDSLGSPAGYCCPHDTVGESGSFGECRAGVVEDIVGETLSDYTPADMDIRPLMTLYPKSKRM